MRVSKRYLPGMLAAFALCFGLAGQACAASLGKVNVASHLGEPFFAEVPLVLKAGETLAGLSVELASAADYNLLEMYRDPALQKLRVNVVSDTRGNRISIISEQPVEAPFFNLVLRVRRGRATQFKRYPVFLDLPGIAVRTPVVTPAVRPESEPVASVEPGQAAPPVAALPLAAGSGTAPKFEPFDGWARIRRYGPMVYGDTLGIVARRLLLDDRYTLPQVMAALYTKNSSRFIEHNMNMIEAGTYLDVPTAAEVKAISPKQARTMLAEHARRWRVLKKLPRYAAVAKAQKSRYNKRVRVGRKAVGKAGSSARTSKGKGAQAGAAPPVAGAEAAGAPGGGAATLAALRQRNEKLTQQLRESERTVSQLQSGKPPDADMIAASERIKRLELKLARLQSELEAASKQVGQGSQKTNWLTNLLAGSVVLLLIALGYLLRRERPHPAMMPESEAAVPGAASAGQLAPGLLETPAGAPPEEAPASEEPVAEGPEQMTAGGQPPEQGGSEVAEEAEGVSGEDEQLDADVDYVAEADVYLRYGMDEEAINQLRMAIRQNEHNANAHSKLVQVLHAQGDESALEAAIAHGARVLSGDDLALFEATVSSLDLEDREAGESRRLPTMEYSGGEEHEAHIEAGETVERPGMETSPATEADGSLQPEGGENLEPGGLDWLLEEDADEKIPGAAQEEMLEELAEVELAGLESDVTQAVASTPESTSETDAGEAPFSSLQPGGDEKPEPGDLDWLTDENADEPASEIAAGAEGADEKPDAGLSRGGEAETGEPEMPQAAGEAAESAGLAPEAEESEAEEEMAWDDLTSPESAQQVEAGVHESDEEPQEAGEAPEEAVAGTDDGVTAGETGADEESGGAVDHLAEAEAHLRYGMDEEGIHQIRLAIEQNEHDTDAHCKLIQVLYAQGEKQALEEAIKHGAEALGGEGLQQFMEAVSALDLEEADVEEARATLNGQQTGIEAEDVLAAGPDGGVIAAPDGDIQAAGAENESWLDSSAGPEAGEGALQLDDDQQAFDVSKELDGLLADFDSDASENKELADEPQIDVSSDSLSIDMARSQLAQGDLNAAEKSFTSALDGSGGCEALLGLADIAQQHGEKEKAAEFLARAEPMLDNDELRSRFDQLKEALNKS